MGNKKTIGPALGIVSDVLFVTLNIYVSLWLCAVFAFVMTLVHLRNWIKWKKETN